MASDRSYLVIAWVRPGAIGQAPARVTLAVRHEKAAAIARTTAALVNTE